MQKSVEDLTDHLKKIVKAEQKQSIQIPTEPTLNIPQRKNTPTFGDITNGVKALDEKFLSDKSKFMEDAWKMKENREAERLGDKYEQNQSRYQPNIDESFIGFRIDSLFEFEAEGHSELVRWCQGEVIDICDGTWLKPNARTACYKEGETVKILWDEIEECNIPQHETILEIPSRKWKKQCIGAWRKDVTFR